MTSQVLPMLLPASIPWLSVSIWLPIFAGLVIAVAGSGTSPLLNQKQVRQASLAAAVLSFLVTVPILAGFIPSFEGFQFVEQVAWIDRFQIQYFLGIDGISLWFIPLTALITVVVVVAGWKVIEDRQAQYMGSFLILSGLMVGVFSALDGILFYVFFEATLIPMYLIVGIWGGARRVYAAFKFFLYTLLGSLLTLVAILYLYAKSGSFSILAWHVLPLGLTEQIFIFIATGIVIFRKLLIHTF